MKKISIVGGIVLFVIAGVVAVAVFRKPQSAILKPPQQGKADQKPRADLQETVLPKPRLPEVQESSLLQLKVAPVGVEQPKVKPVEMSDEEYRQIEESFAVTAVMKDLLDDGEEVQAIYEARLLLEHPNREVRLETARSLEWIGLPAAMELAKMIDDPDGEIRGLAQEAFWQALDEAEDPVLKRNLMAEALQSDDSEVRMRIVEELVFLPDALSFELLASAMDDPDPEISAQARENAAFVSGEEFANRAAAEAWFAANKESLEME